MGIIIDTKAEEFDLSTQQNLRLIDAERERKKKMDSKEFDKNISVVKREMNALRLMIHEIIGYGEDAESQLDRLANTLEELKKEVRAWKEDIEKADKENEQ